MSPTCMQSLKKIHWKLWEELITQTLYIPFNAKICLKWLSSKGCNSVKINSSSIKNPQAHLQYVPNLYAKFEKDPLKTVRGFDYTNSIPYNAKICLKWLSSKGRNSVKINSRSNKNPHAYLQYVPIMYARFEKDPLKAVGEVDYTNSIPNNAKICLKWLSSKGRNSVKINSRSNKNPHAHLQYVPNSYAKFEKDPLKTVGGVDYTNSIL